MIPTPSPFDYIGYYGPIVLLVIAIMLLINKTKIITLYILFFIINILLNGVIKITIREPRPNGNKLFNEFENTEGTEQYGMPSGHAQSVAYTATFLYLFTKSPDIFMGACFIGAITIYQRYKYKRHSILQLLAGATIGALVAGLCNKIYSYKI
jgi:membrane-associated phospholipid phosphatase